MIHMLFSIVSVTLFCALRVVAQRPSWTFPDRLTLANGEGNNSPTRPVSFLNDTLYQFDLTKPFSIVAQLSVSDKRFWRAALSIESPDATSALFRIALPPDQMNFNVAWMQSTQARGGAINTAAVAPGLNTDFHFALVKDNSNITIYIDGVRQSSNPFNGQIFSPPKKQIVLGRTKLDGNSLRSQWNGVIRNVKMWRFAISEARVLLESDN